MAAIPDHPAPLTLFCIRAIQNGHLGVICEPGETRTVPAHLGQVYLDTGCFRLVPETPADPPAPAPASQAEPPKPTRRTKKDDE